MIGTFPIHVETIHRTSGFNIFWNYILALLFGVSIDSSFSSMFYGRWKWGGFELCSKVILSLCTNRLLLILINSILLMFDKVSFVLVKYLNQPSIKAVPF